MTDINEILNFLSERQIQLEILGESEEIAFQIVISELTPNQYQIWYEWCNQQRLNKLSDK